MWCAENTLVPTLCISIPAGIYVVSKGIVIFFLTKAYEEDDLASDSSEGIGGDRT